MGLLAEAKEADTRTGLDEGCEDESIRRDGVHRNHATEEGQRLGRTIGVGEGG